MSIDGHLQRHADLSADRMYRYRLSRTWADGPRATFIMLNPSTADERADDPTLLSCIGFARRWGFGGLIVGNLYALRATRPADLWTAADPVGTENDRYLAGASETRGLLVAAWGAHAKRERAREVMALPGFEQLMCLRTTKQGHPSHPLYLPRSLMPMPWTFDVQAGTSR